MGRIYINPTLERSIRSYCELNGIDDINAFANRCAIQGFNIVKFGTSPMDNVNREKNGIFDVTKNSPRRYESDIPIQASIDDKKVEEKSNMEEIKPIDDKKENIKVRKIRVIKKD